MVLNPPHFSKHLKKSQLRFVLPVVRHVRFPHALQLCVHNVHPTRSSRLCLPGTLLVRASSLHLHRALPVKHALTVCASNMRFIPSANPICSDSALPMSQCVTSGTCHVSKTFCASHLLLVSRGLSSCASHLRIYPSHQSRRLYVDRHICASLFYHSKCANMRVVFCVSCSACRVLRVVFYVSCSACHDLYLDVRFGL